MRVKDVMIPIVSSVQVDASLRDAAEKMKALNIDPLPVCDEDRLVGVLTEQALIDRAERDGLGVGSQLVSDVMTTDTVCCFADQDVSAALKEIEGEPSTRMPVIDQDHHLVGIVSLEDLRKGERIVNGEVSAVSDVESIDDLVHFDDDRVDFMSDASFPASDPSPPPTTLGSSRDEDAPQKSGRN